MGCMNDRVFFIRIELTLRFTVLKLQFEGSRPESPGSWQVYGRVRLNAASNLFGSE